MANVPVADLSKEQQDELLCTYAALILHDDGAEVTPEAMNNLIKAAGCSVEGYWPMLMTKMIKNVGIDALVKMGGGGGGGGGGARSEGRRAGVVLEHGLRIKAPLGGRPAERVHPQAPAVWARLLVMVVGARSRSPLREMGVCGQALRATKRIRFAAVLEGLQGAGPGRRHPDAHAVGTRKPDAVVRAVGSAERLGELLFAGEASHLVLPRASRPEQL
mmetsp:Transcript_13137/g.37841  ORF Transcript_13137/g.37841 Transcript_13137/m.37841 type:complete len:218 (+) Transcript_13137:67-720(+)